MQIKSWIWDLWKTRFFWTCPYLDNHTFNPWIKKKCKKNWKKWSKSLYLLVMVWLYWEFHVDFHSKVMHLKFTLKILKFTLKNMKLKIYLILRQDYWRLLTCLLHSATAVHSFLAFLADVSMIAILLIGAVFSYFEHKEYELLTDCESYIETKMKGSVYVNLAHFNFCIVGFILSHLMK